MSVVTEQEKGINTQAKALVDSAILRDIQRKPRAQNDGCSGSDYENCIYENRE